MKKKPILDGYKQQGKKFTSPFKTMPGGFKEVHYVDHILPEIVWLQYLVDSLGKREGIHTAIEFLKICHERQTEGEKEPCFLTVLGNLNEDDWNYIKQRLVEHDLLDPLVYSLTPFVRLYPENNPLRSLIEERDDYTDDDILSGRSALSTLFSRHTQDSLLTQAIIVGYNLSVEKLHFIENVRFPELNLIETAFESEGAKHASSFVRILVNSSFSVGEQIDSSWAQYFWNRSGNLTDFKNPKSASLKDHSDLHPIEAFAYKFAELTIVNRDKIWRAIPINCYTSEEYEVIGGLLSR